MGERYTSGGLVTWVVAGALEEGAGGTDGRFCPVSPPHWVARYRLSMEQKQSTSKVQ